MSNKQAEITRINLGGSVNLNKVKTDIESYDSGLFNHKDSLTYGGVLSNWHRYYISDCIALYNGQRIFKNGRQIGMNDKPLFYIENDEHFSVTELKNYTQKSELKEGLKIEKIQGNVVVNGKAFYTNVNLRDFYVSVLKFGQDNYLISFNPYGTSSLIGDRTNALFSFYFNSTTGNVEIKEGLYYDDRINVGFMTETTNINETNLYELDKPGDGIDTLEGWLENKTIIGNKIEKCKVTCYDYYTELCFYKDKSWYYNLRDSEKYLFDLATDRLLLSTVEGYPTWKGGLKFSLGNGWDVLYNNGGVIEGLSYNNNIVIRDIDKILEIKEKSIVFAYMGKYYEVRIEDGAEIKIVGDFLLLNTTSYLNTVDLRNGRVFSRSDDYNNRLIPWINTNLDSTNESMIMQFATGYNETYYADNIPNFATINAPVNLKVNTTNIDLVNKYIQVYDLWNDSSRISIDVFTPSVAGGVPVYRYSVGETDRELRSSLEINSTYFPSSSDNVIFNYTVLDDVSPTYLNTSVVKCKGGYSVISTIDNKQNPVLGYFLLTMIDFDTVFIIQGQYYAVSDKYIMGITVNNSSIEGVKVVANKKDLKFIGNTTQMAFFYSTFDKSIYSFTGDQNLTKFIEASGINSVGTCYNNPAIGLIALQTNIGTLIYYSGEMCLIDETSDTIYFDDGSLIIGNWRYCLDNREGWETIPIEIETEYLGVGNNLKSVNDTVYIRVYGGDHSLDETGEIVVSASTLNEISKETNSKTFKINKGVWDKDTETFFIRYQPGFQSCSGFMVKIKSTHPIADLFIGHQVESVQSSKYNI